MTPSNTSDKSRALAFSLVALSLAVLATAGRLFSLLFFYDRIGYYQSGGHISQLYWSRSPKLQLLQRRQRGQMPYRSARQKRND